MSNAISANPSSSSAAALYSSSIMATAADALTPIKPMENTNTNTIQIPLASVESSRGAVGNVSSCISNSATICRYFLRGTCRFGANCRFLHDTLDGEVISCSRSRNDDNANEAPSSSSSSSSSTTTISSTSTLTSTSATSSTTIKRKLSSKLTNWAKAPPFVPKSVKLIYAHSELETRAFSLAAAAAAAAAATTEEISGFCNRPRTWADVVRETSNNVQFIRHHPEPGSVISLCPYGGPCPYGVNCIYALHMEPCKMCDRYCLHPTDLEQRRLHIQKCLKHHEQAMELSFAIARSRDKMCGICMENVLEKTGKERRFGILPNCNHIFCLTCIRKWRQATDFSHKVIRSCPECRIASDFVCPSPFWVETKEQKDKLLNDYRTALGRKDCKYFKKGNGKCPFGNKCFYKHALASGKVVDVGGPRRARKVQRDRGDLMDFFDIYLWEFVEQRDFNFLESLFSSSDYSDLDLDYSDTE